MVRFVFSLTVVVVLVLSFGHTPVKAQSNNTTQTFQLQQFRPWGDPYGGFQNQSGLTLGQWNYQLGLSFNYAKDPLIMRDQSGNRALEVLRHQIASDIHAGVGLLPWLDVILRIPLTLYQDGEFPSGVSDGRSLSGFFLSDIQLGAKVQFLREKRHLLDMGLTFYLGIPISNPISLNGSQGVSFGGNFNISKQVSIVRLMFNVGYRYQAQAEFGNLLLDHELTYGLGAVVEAVSDTFELVFDLAGSTSLSRPTPESTPMEFYFGGRYYPMTTKDLAITLGGAVGVMPGVGTPQFRVVLGVRWSPILSDQDKDGLIDRKDRCPKTPGPLENQGCPWGDKDKDGLTDNIDKCPDVAGPKENKGCPWDDRDKDGLTDNIDKCPDTPGPKENKGCPWGDKDKDGLTDNVDKCPDIPGPKENKGCPWGDKDKDGLTDNVDKCPDVPGPKENKGCPDTDRDKDGIVDRLDKCPDVPGLKKKQGCPIVLLVKVVGSQIKVLQKIFFNTGSARIRRVSFPVLSQVLEVLKSRPKISVRVEGHTDNVGGAKYNLGLSRRRAKSVRSYLIKKGIDEGRLTSVGYGLTKPVLPNTSRKNRSKNRRVEFHIVSPK